MEYESLFSQWLNSMSSNQNSSSNYVESYTDGSETTRYTDTDD